MEPNGSSPLTKTDQNGSSPTTIEHKAYARIGLLGNPSDVYYGRTMSLNIENFWACVSLQPSTDLLILPHPTHDLVKFISLTHLVLIDPVCIFC